MGIAQQFVQIIIAIVVVTCIIGTPFVFICVEYAFPDHAADMHGGWYACAAYEHALIMKEL